MYSLYIFQLLDIPMLNINHVLQDCQILSSVPSLSNASYVSNRLFLGYFLLF